jgi:protein associated with RNAse G/E
VDVVLKIRGIYATALTGFFLKQGFKIALPSRPVAERFYGAPGFDVLQGPDVEVTDLITKQGVILVGEESALNAVGSTVHGLFHDAVTRRRAADILEVEFPLLSKSLLDEIRHRVVPTLINHHRLKIIASDEVDKIERDSLAKEPEKREELSRTVEKCWIWDHYEKGEKIAIEHVKLEGKVLRLSEGEVVAADSVEKLLILRRSGFKARSKYDGLGIPKREGDYALSEVREGDWSYRHTYYRVQGKKLGAYYNVNTPVEFYPDRVRYIDLEIDVVQFPGDRIEVVDEGELEKRFEQGYVSAKMREKAKREVSSLKKRLISRAR